MAQTKRPWQENLTEAFGEQGSAVATAVTQRVGLVVGGVTTDTTNVFERIPIGTSAAGTAVQVDLIGTEPVVVQIGTITAGTINTGTINAGTVDLLKAGTITALANGTIGAGTLNTLGTVANVNAGSITVVAGTVSAGTVNTGTINTGTIDLLKAGTITKVEGGSIAVTAGTIDAGSVVVTAGTVSAGTINTGTVNTGTIDLLKAGTVTEIGTVLGIGGTVSVDIAGTEPIIVEVGTISAGTINTGTVNAGTIDLLKAGTITKVEGGSIAVTAGTGIVTSGSISVIAGTIGTVGTIAGVGGTVKVDIAGTEPIIVEVGTIAAGTINTGTVNAGTIDLLKAGTVTKLEGGSVVVTAGTVAGAAASGAAASGNPVVMAGTDAGGTVYGILVDTAGNPQVDLVSGSMAITAGTFNTGTIDLLSAGTITKVEGGSIAVTAGTIGGGSITVTTGTVNAGTVDLLKAGTITRVEQGSINVTAGTVDTELPAAAALPDGAAPGNVPLVGAILVGNDGANVRRVYMAAGADGLTNAAYGIYTVGYNYLYNGSTWDRVRNNTLGTILSSAERTVSTVSTDQVNYNAKGIKLYVNISAMSGTPTLDIAVQTKDPISGTYFTLSGGTLPQFGTISTDELTIYPGIAETGGESVSDVIPRTWRIDAAQGAGGSITYSVGAQYII